MRKFRLVLILIFVLQSYSYAGIDNSEVPSGKQTPQALYLTALEAYRMKTELADKALFVDVRTRAELEFVGVPDTIDVNIPYVFNRFDQWNEKKHRFKKYPNSNFTVAIEDRLAKAGLDKNSTIIVMCRSGYRSAMAAELLHKHNYNNVYSVIDGFEGDKIKSGPDAGKRNKNGWKNSNLPWSYKLEKEKMYIE